jgi:LmbE family N-acetylglucosaminyl deacetylase
MRSRRMSSLICRNHQPVNTLRKSREEDFGKALLLRTLEAGKTTRKITVVFAPHPDDETVGCGGTIAMRTSEEYEVLIIVMTDGRHAFSQVLGINSDPSPAELKQIRRAEMRRAVRALGVPEENITFLDFEDGKLDENSEEAEQKVTQILKENRPTEVFFPYAREDHPDHRATNRIVRNSIKKSGLQPSKYQYSVNQRYARVNPMVDKFLSSFNHKMVQFDISKFLSQKERAMKEFKSEIAIISSKQKRPVLTNSTIRRHLRNREIFYVD